MDRQDSLNCLYFYNYRVVYEHIEALSSGPGPSFEWTTMALSMIREVVLLRNSLYVPCVPASSR